jgi:hypothetical protein
LAWGGSLRCEACILILFTQQMIPPAARPHWYNIVQPESSTVALLLRACSPGSQSSLAANQATALKCLLGSIHSTSTRALPVHKHHLIMTSIPSLPVEILRYCVSYLDTADLKEIRLTSSTFRAIATEALFNVATIRPTIQSRDKFATLIKNEELRRYIHTVSVLRDCRMLYCGGSMGWAFERRILAR